MSKNKMGKDSPIPKFIYLKLRRRYGVESLTILEEGEFKVPIDECISWENASLTRQHSLRSGVGTCKKILKIKIPFQILFYPFRCMFKIMKGYKNFDFTPSGKSLKKTLLQSR